MMASTIPSRAHQGWMASGETSKLPTITASAHRPENQPLGCRTWHTGQNNSKHSLFRHFSPAASLQRLPQQCL
ncbi:hypothetical protein QC762_508485 [Podospora pseudocomata]|uniref:Uncharacterized protein n=1 Tax=Podospora pseudocomata TaxID=2093779 RepID=A0ABR0GCY7_9PEZI|nr:hypothetical protein QC762_508485 [Podospora pseudocomata]